MVLLFGQTMMIKDPAGPEDQSGQGTRPLLEATGEKNLISEDRVSRGMRKIFVSQPLRLLARCI
jgi:hypothetical protein